MGKFPRCAARAIQGRRDRRRRLAVGIIVIEKPGGEADRQIRDQAPIARQWQQG